MRRVPGDEHEGSSSPSRAPRPAPRSPLRGCAGRRARRSSPHALRGRRARRGARAAHRRRHDTGSASAPWPGAGSIVSGESHSVTSCSRPSRRMPAAASSAPSYSPAATFPIRVSTFPRIERISRSGRSALSWAARRRLLVPTTAPFARWASDWRSRATRQSRTSSRRVTAPTTTPSASSVGRSFSECTARSISPSRSARSSSSVKSPLPPISGSGSPRRLGAVARRRDHSRLALEVRPGGRQQADDRVGLHPRERRGPGSEGDRRLPRRSAH